MRGGENEGEATLRKLKIEKYFWSYRSSVVAGVQTNVTIDDYRLIIAITKTAIRTASFNFQFSILNHP